MQKISIIAFNKNIFCWTELLCILAKSDEKKKKKQNSEFSSLKKIKKNFDTKKGLVCE